MKLDVYKKAKFFCVNLMLYSMYRNVLHLTVHLITVVAEFIVHCVTFC